MAEKKIIVRMPNWVGDLVMATPILCDIKAVYPTAEITAMCHSGLEPLLKHSPYVDAIYSFTKPCGKEKGKQTKEIIAHLQKQKYDVGILLTNSFSSAWWFWKGNVKKRIGYRMHLRSMLLSQSVPLPKWHQCQHLVITYKMLLATLKMPLSNSRPELFLQEKELLDARQLLTQRGIDLKKDVVIGINPGAAYGTAKCWLPERFTALVRMLLNIPSLYIVLFGDKFSASITNEIASTIDSKRVIDLAAKTSLRQLMALIQCCDLFITNDSGPMHIAAALNVQQIALFGSTSDITTRPYQENAVVIHKHVSCSPCYLRTCPIDFTCMKQIETEEVYSAVQIILRHLPKVR